MYKASHIFGLWSA